MLCRFGGAVFALILLCGGLVGDIVTGDLLGLFDGLIEGTVVGEIDGVVEGVLVGEVVGFLVGAEVGGLVITSNVDATVSLMLTVVIVPPELFRMLSTRVPLEIVDTNADLTSSKISFPQSWHLERGFCADTIDLNLTDDSAKFLFEGSVEPVETGTPQTSYTFTYCILPGSKLEEPIDSSNDFPMTSAKVVILVEQLTLIVTAASTKIVVTGVIVGDVVGVLDGLPEGDSDGLAVGDIVGGAVGLFDGLVEGELLGE